MPLPPRPSRGGLDLATRGPLVLGSLRLEPATLSLQGPAARVSVEPRMMQVLIHLADAGGDVVSRESLLRACWGAVVVGDDALHRAVAGARRALRDCGADDIAIDTIPRVGYRLGGLDAGGTGATGTTQTTGSTSVAGVTAVAAAAAGAPATPREQEAPSSSAGRPAPPGAASSPRRRVVLAGGLAAGAAAMAGGTAWFLRDSEALSHEASSLIDQASQALRLAMPEAESQGVAFLEQAVRLAPENAPAWGLLALARRQTAEYAAPEATAAMLATAEAAATRALAINPRQPDAMTARALIRPLFGHWAEIEADLARVLELAPDHLPSLDSLAFSMASTGVIAAHYPLRLRTVELDPLHAGYNFRAIYSHWMNGQLAAADRAGERGLELWSRHVATWMARYDVFKYSGRPDRAMAMLDDEAARPPLPPELLAALRVTVAALAGGGPAERAAARSAALASVGRGGPFAAVSATLDLAALGETELALDVTEAYLLERGPLRAGTSWRPGQVLHNDVRRRLTAHLFLPVTAPLRAEPRFAAIAEETGLAAAWQRPGREPDHLAGPKPRG